MKVFLISVVLYTYYSCLCINSSDEEYEEVCPTSKHEKNKEESNYENVGLEQRLRRLQLPRGRRRPRLPDPSRFQQPEYVRLTGSPERPSASSPNLSLPQQETGGLGARARSKSPNQQRPRSSEYPQQRFPPYQDSPTKRTPPPPPPPPRFCTCHGPPENQSSTKHHSHEHDQREPVREVSLNIKEKSKAFSTIFSEGIGEDGSWYNKFTSKTGSVYIEVSQNSKTLWISDGVKKCLEVHVSGVGTDKKHAILYFSDGTISTYKKTRKRWVKVN